MDISKVIGQRINILLTLKNIKQKELAATLKVKDNVISYFVSGKRTPNIEQITEIAKYFNVSTDYLLGLSDTPSTDTNLKAICEFVGLSEDSINELHNWNIQKFKKSVYEVWIDFIDTLIACPANNYTIANDLSEYISLLRKSNVLETENNMSDALQTLRNSLIPKMSDSVRKSYIDFENSEEGKHARKTKKEFSQWQLKETQDSAEFCLYKIQKDFIRLIKSYGEKMKTHQVLNPYVNNGGISNGDD